MRKFQLKDFMKSASAFWLVSASGIDSAILSLDRLGWLRAESGWYVTGPLAAWALVSLPLSIALFERMRDSAYKHPADIKPIVTDGSATARAIPWHKPSGTSTIFANVAKSIFGADPEPPTAPKITGWQVPIDDTCITVGEKELTKFLELCDRRPRYKFSRRYWTERRRPPMPLTKYNAVMELLTTSGLVEARQAGASGWLVGGLRPHNAITYLKHESQWRI